LFDFVTVLRRRKVAFHKTVHTFAHLSAGVDVSTRVADGDSADNFAVAQRTQLPCMAWNARTNQRIGRKRNWLQLPIGRHVERIGAKTKNNDRELEKVGDNCCIMHTISKRDRAWLGHVLRRTNLLTLSVERRLLAKKSCGYKKSVRHDQ